MLRVYAYLPTRPIPADGSLISDNSSFIRVSAPDDRSQHTSNMSRGPDSADVQRELDVEKQRVIQTTRTDMKRTGLHTEVIENIEEESIGKRVIARALIPFIRPRTITVSSDCFRPGIRMYAFFDGKAVSQFCTPSSSEFSNTDSPVEGSPLVTNGAGSLNFTFRIPEYRFAGQQNVPKFKTGEVDFRLTSSETNIKSPAPSTVGQTEYIAKGVVQTTQQTIEATRNAEIVRDLSLIHI